MIWRWSLIILFVQQKCQISTFPKIFSKQKQGNTQRFPLFFCVEMYLFSSSSFRGFAPTGPNGPTLQEEVDRLEAGLSRPSVGGFRFFFVFWYDHEV